MTSRSPQTVVYQINPKAVWADGTAITGQDFVYTWQAQSLEKHLDPHGKVVSTKREAWETLMLDGQPYRRTLTREGKTDFLVDLTAMANGDGGAILYGGEQGKGEQRGQLVALRGAPGEPLGQLVMVDRVEGRHRGPRWNDGDFYKWMEAASALLAVARNDPL